MAKSTEDPLPPEIPETLETLDRAIVLLGNLSQQNGKLREKYRKELAGLIGECPKQHLAAIWKAALRKIRQQEIARGG